MFSQAFPFYTSRFTPNGMIRLFGIETEYGIAREDQDAVDPVVESMELVRAHLTASFERRCVTSTIGVFV